MMIQRRTRRRFGRSDSTSHCILVEAKWRDGGKWFGLPAAASPRAARRREHRRRQIESRRFQLRGKKRTQTRRTQFVVLVTKDVLKRDLVALHAPNFRQIRDL